MKQAQLRRKSVSSSGVRAVSKGEAERHPQVLGLNILRLCPTHYPEGKLSLRFEEADYLSDSLSPILYSSSCLTLYSTP